MTTATVHYDVTVSSNNTQTQVHAAMAAADLSGGIASLASLGATLASDSTTNPSGTKVRRTLAFTLGATFLAAFPTANAQISAFTNFFTSILSGDLVTPVAAATPTIT